MDPIYIVVCQKAYGGGEEWIRAFYVESHATVYAFNKAGDRKCDFAIYRVDINDKNNAKLIWSSGRPNKDEI
jgi:hypothetical protein